MPSQDSRTDVVAGRNPVREALERGDGRVEKVLLQKGTHGSAIDAIRNAARAANVPVQYVPQPKVDRLAPQAAHQGVVAVVAPVAYADLDEMLSAIAPTLDDVRAQKPVLVALDEVEDPRNFGAILRSALGAGVSGVVVPERRAAPLSAVAVKASAGAALQIPIARAGNLAEALHALKERGYWVVGLEGGGAAEAGPPSGGAGPERTTVWDYDWDRAVAVVVGNEGKGLRPGVRAVCDVLVEIPLRGPAESLNVSVAAGVALFAAVRGR
ncbi:23S rRNA (guanosine(2251)-2'-O)-methyltransferase RlmB [Rubrivirga sp. S365]|uniref:23S rRNA (Guanosine(2251)-2'-O)-methyltransferase RlmB n=1 Tax=Rubrivirga litoralis TaxID=3075598 RepID=A0ABU3BTW5_9BACT|nr:MULTISPECIES: 23S rRNA (guanosine(2251)-2'-O)-methyltransferase RlmB [unclassified Rubrivirga]MDT0632733.1 23S rRNA (guanosine(2251)-2'-O)-methyltransferase RlmB [Rubrivirga sp. F394]MDT7856962.1 23S rRNA (guanosine(2251)-2'-O)-methyltransferase RlmB [Rubrivirga sp. S365]